MSEMLRGEGSEFPCAVGNIEFTDTRLCENTINGCTGLAPVVPFRLKKNRPSLSESLLLRKM